MWLEPSVAASASFVFSKAASNLCLSRLRERQLQPSSHHKSIAATVCWLEHLSISWIACNLSSMPLLGCCATGENTTTSRRSSVMFYTGFKFPFELSSRSACLSTSRFMGQRLGTMYLRDYCKETHSSASGLRLRSTDECDLLVRRMKTRFGDRAFSAAGPRCWNKLPAALRAADSIDSFKTGLKTYLFSNAYSAYSAVS